MQIELESARVTVGIAGALSGAPYVERTNNQRVVSFFQEHQTEVDSPRFRRSVPELWAEVTIPREGPPRPVRLGLKRAGEIQPLALY